MQADEIGGELVGLARSRAVADRHQLHFMHAAQARERRKGSVPLPLGLVRVDRVGRGDLAGAVDDSDFHAGAEAGVETERRPRAGRCREKQVAQIAGEDAHGFLFREFPKAQPRIDFDAQSQFRAPGPAHGVQQPGIARSAAIGDARMDRDAAFEHACRLRRAGFVKAQVERLFLLAAKQRENAM